MCQSRSKKIKYSWLVLLLALACSSCITNRGNTYLQTDSKLPQYEEVPYQYYRLQPNDMLTMRVLSLNEDAQGIYNTSTTSANSQFNNYRIYEDGTVDLPFLNGIPVAGLTLREAAHKIQDTLQTIIPDAMVKLAMANEQFYVVGEGKRGAYSFYKEKLNIFQAISLAGDFSKNGDKRRVRIIRPVPGSQPKVMEFDLRTASIINSEYYYVYPNDVIYVSSIKGDFWKIQDYSSAVGTLSTSLNFLISVLNLGLTIAP